MKQEIVAILYNVRSVHNVGSMFRTADAAGVKKIYLCGITPSPLDRFGNILPQFAKVSLGAGEYIEWEKEKDIKKVLKKVKTEGYNVYAVEQSRNSIPYNRAPRAQKIALVVGNEVKGLSPSILKASDKVLEIPIRGKKESLNVSVAFGIAVFGLLYK